MDEAILNNRNDRKILKRTWSDRRQKCLSKEAKVEYI